MIFSVRVEDMGTRCLQSVQGLNVTVRLWVEKVPPVVFVIKGYRQTARGLQTPQRWLCWRVVTGRLRPVLTTAVRNCGPPLIPPPPTHTHTHTTTTTRPAPGIDCNSLWYHQNSLSSPGYCGCWRRRSACSFRFSTLLPGWILSGKQVSGDEKDKVFPQETSAKRVWCSCVFVCH